MSSSQSCLSDRLSSSQMEYIDVKVHNPTIHNTHNEGRYTTYEVSLQTNSLSFTLNKSVVQRRYSDFVWLRRALSQTTTIKPPNLPMGRLFGIFNEHYLNERQVILTNFLQKVVRETLFLSSSALHLFLQTQLDRKEMARMLKDAKRRGSMNSITRAIGMYGSACTDWSACTDAPSCSTIAENHRSSIDSGHGESGEFPQNHDHSYIPHSCQSSDSSFRGFKSENNNHKNGDDFVVCDHLPVNSSPIPVDKAAYTDVLWKVDSFPTSPISFVNCSPFSDSLRSSHTSRSLGNKLRLSRHSLSPHIRRVASDSNVPARGKQGMFHVGESSDNESSSSGQQSPDHKQTLPKTNQHLLQVSQKLKSELPNIGDKDIGNLNDQVAPVTKNNDTDATTKLSQSLLKGEEKISKNNSTQKDNQTVSNSTHEQLNNLETSLTKIANDDNDIVKPNSCRTTNNQYIVDKNKDLLLLKNQHDTIDHHDVKSKKSTMAINMIDNNENEIKLDMNLPINNDEESNIVKSATRKPFNTSLDGSNIEKNTILNAQNERKIAETECILGIPNNQTIHIVDYQQA